MTRAFEAIAGIYSENVTDTSEAEPERLAGSRMSAAFLCRLIAADRFLRTLLYGVSPLDLLTLSATILLLAAVAALACAHAPRREDRPAGSNSRRVAQASVLRPDIAR